jgi:hypothetical protein
LTSTSQGKAKDGAMTEGLQREGGVEVPSSL